MRISKCRLITGLSIACTHGFINLSRTTRTSTAGGELTWLIITIFLLTYHFYGNKFRTYNVRAGNGKSFLRHHHKEEGDPVYGRNRRCASATYCKLLRMVILSIFTRRQEGTLAGTPVAGIPVAGTPVAGYSWWLSA